MTRAWRFGVTAAVLALLAGGCRRPHLCENGAEETPAGADAVWCKDARSGMTIYIVTHPGTRQMRQRCQFVHGSLEGPFVATHPDGKPFLEGQYQAGHAQGKWVQSDSSGKKVAEGEYREGRLVGGAPVAVAAVCESIPALQ